MRFELSILDKNGDELEKFIFSSEDRFEKISTDLDQKNIASLINMLKEFGVDDQMQIQLEQENRFRII